MRPRVQGQPSRAADVAVDAADHPIPARPAVAGACVKPVSVVTGLLLQQHRPPVVAQSRRTNPGLKSHSAREIEAVGVRHAHERIRAVKRQRVAIATRVGARPAGVRNRAIVSVARLISGGRAGAGVEAVRGDETGRRPRVRHRYGDSCRRRGVPGHVSCDRGEGMRAVADFGRIPGDRVRSRRVFEPEIRSVELELDAGDGVVVGRVRGDLERAGDSGAA